MKFLLIGLLLVALWYFAAPFFMPSILRGKKRGSVDSSKKKGGGDVIDIKGRTKD